MYRFNLKALALSLGITWALGLLFLGWVGAFGWGLEAVDVFSSFYIGYEPTFIGGVIGAVWGFIDGAVGGIVIGFLYNLFLPQEKKAKVKKK